MKCDLTCEQVRHLFDYEPLTGILRWRNPTSRKCFIGQVAGTRSRAGYIQVSVKGSLYFAHRLGWVHAFGVWPVPGIDHINHDGTDNRIANLRIATRAQNGANRRRFKNNTSGFKGVTRSGNGWQAQVFYDGAYQYLGHFKSPDVAHLAYVEAARSLFGEFANAG